MDIIFGFVLVGGLYYVLNKFDMSLSANHKNILILLVAIIVAFIIIGRIYRLTREFIRQRRLDRQREADEDDEDLEEWQPSPEKQKPRDIIIPRAIDKAVIRYSYTNVTLQLRGGVVPERYIAQPVTFLARENMDAVRALADGDWIGDLVQPTIASVTREWLRTGEPYRAYVTHTDDDKKELAVSVAFYRDELTPLLKYQPNAPEFRLIGTRGEDIQLALLDVPAGTRLDVDFDPDSGKYAVYREDTVVGYLPAAAVKLLEQYGEYSARIYASENAVNDAGLYELRVKIFEP